MAAHWEWLEAEMCPNGLLVEGEEVHGYDEPVSAPLALVFGPDNGAIIEGSYEELMAMLDRARRLLDSSRGRRDP
jgi:hypothetical protein